MVMGLVELAGWVTASLLMVAMVVAWEVGVRVGRREANTPGGASTRIDDATGALLALLLGFTFATAAAKHERRLWLMVDEATAIGDLAGVASVLSEPTRTELMSDIREYLDVRIEAARTPPDDAAVGALVQRTRSLEGRLSSTVARAVREDNAPSVHNALVGHLNAVTTALEKRLAARSDHVPGTILVMLLVSAIVGAFSIGRSQGIAGAWQPMSTSLFLGLVVLVIFVTIDLEQPRRGIVTVPVAALESVRANLTR